MNQSSDKVPHRIELFVVSVVAIQNLRYFKKIEERVKNGREVALPVKLGELYLLVLYRLLFTITAVAECYWLRIGHWQVPLGYFLISGSIYIALGIHPRRPSWFRRAVGKMVNAAKNIKLRLPSPLPHPA